MDPSTRGGWPPFFRRPCESTSSAPPTRAVLAQQDQPRPPAPVCANQPSPRAVTCHDPSVSKPIPPSQHRDPTSSLLCGSVLYTLYSCCVAVIPRTTRPRRFLYTTTPRTAKDKTSTGNPSATSKRGGRTSISTSAGRKTARCSWRLKRKGTTGDHQVTLSVATTIDDDLEERKGCIVAPAF
jgi:hypothetical protein